MVVLPKSSGAVRICIELRPLNEGALRELLPVPTVDETLAQLSGATAFSKVDTNSGFRGFIAIYTFISPFGRYCFKKLPFSIASAPELFQRRINAVLDGVLCHMDDVLVFGAMH